jgi:acyl carrier protein
LSNFTYDEFREFIVNFIEPKLLHFNFDKKKLPDETDLLSSGILDSFDFIDLVMHIEEKTGLSIDMSQINSDNFTSLNGFIREALFQQK